MLYQAGGAGFGEEKPAADFADERGSEELKINPCWVERWALGAGLWAEKPAADFTDERGSEELKINPCWVERWVWALGFGRKNQPRISRMNADQKN
jgi:hypothetical protein